MHERTGAVGLGLCLWMGLGAASAQARPAEGGKGATMSSQAKGTFEVKLTPVAEEGAGGLASARLAFDKAFQGDLLATSKGEMWTADTSVEGSAGYVAIEKVSGTLHGRKGAFTLLHQGTMQRGGNYNMMVVVVPDSGTGELAGLAGRMAIIIANGKHSYQFEYSLAQAP